jgi:hypothetical protein
MKTEDYIRAYRKGSREGELSFEHGWKCVHKVHRSNKTYQRKPKHRGLQETKC